MACISIHMIGLFNFVLTSWPVNLNTKTASNNLLFFAYYSTPSLISTTWPNACLLNAHVSFTCMTRRICHSETLAMNWVFQEPQPTGTTASESYKGSLLSPIQIWPPQAFLQAWPMKSMQPDQEWEGMWWCWCPAHGISICITLASLGDASAGGSAWLGAKKEAIFITGGKNKVKSMGREYDGPDHRWLEGCYLHRWVQHQEKWSEPQVT